VFIPTSGNPTPVSFNLKLGDRTMRLAVSCEAPDPVPQTSILSTDAFFDAQAARQAPHIFGPALRLYDGSFFLIAATKSFDPDPHRETALIA
jgi:hypothetical protein